MANLKEIQEFLENLAKTDLYKVEIKTDDIELNVQLKPKVTVTSVAGTVVQQPVAQQAPLQVNQPVANNESKSAEDNGLLTIKSPIVGTFYRKPKPESPAFAEIGQSVKKGDIVCIIEAMKLFNEIESDVSGEIVKIFVEDAQPVEFDQPLFLVKPL